MDTWTSYTGARDKNNPGHPTIAAALPGQIPWMRAPGRPPLYHELQPSASTDGVGILDNGTMALIPSRAALAKSADSPRSAAPFPRGWSHAGCGRRVGSGSQAWPARGTYTGSHARPADPTPLRSVWPWTRMGKGGRRSEFGPRGTEDDVDLPLHPISRLDAGLVMSVRMRSRWSFVKASKYPGAGVRR